VALAILLALTYAIPTALANKTPNVGAPFQFLLVLAAAMCLFALFRRFPRHPSSIALAAAVSVLAVFRSPEAFDRADAPAVAARGRTLEGLLEALEREQVKPGEPVFLTTVGYIGVNSLQYQFQKRRWPAPHFFDQALSDDPELFRTMIAQAAYVVASDPGNDEVFYTAPSAFLQEKTLAMVRDDPSFVEIARFPTWRGKYHYLFGRRERARNPLAAPPPPIDPPAPVLVRGFAASGEDNWRWTRREFEIEFPAPRGLRAELRLRMMIPQSSLEKLGPVTLTADVSGEGSHRETISQQAVQDFVYRYTIQRHLVSTVRVRFRLDKALVAEDGGELGLLFQSAELNPL
jgi:hypothetical protein